MPVAAAASHLLGGEAGAAPYCTQPAPTDPLQGDVLGEKDLGKAKTARGREGQERSMRKSPANTEVSEEEDDIALPAESNALIFFTSHYKNLF